MHFKNSYFFCLAFLLSMGALAYQSTDYSETTVDWQMGEIRSLEAMEIPKVNYPGSADYYPGVSPSNLTEAREFAMEKSGKILRQDLYRRIENLNLTAEETIREKLHTDRNFLEKFNQIYENHPEVLEFRFRRNRLISNVSLKFQGDSGLYSYLQMPFETESFPVTENPLGSLSPSYTGLIIDARNINVHTALFPSITTESGLEIYSPYYVSGESVRIRGYIQYMTDPGNATNQIERIGKNPLFVPGISASGRRNTTISIPSSEAKKLLSHPKTIQALKRCRVIVILKPQGS